MKKFVKLFLVMVMFTCLFGCGTNVASDAVNSKDAQGDQDAATIEVYETNTQKGLLGMFFAIGDFYMPEDAPAYEGDSNAGEIDVVYFLGEEGSASGQSYITMENPAFEPEEAKATLKRWYGMTDVTVTELDDEIYTHHVYGENGTNYYEAYFLIGENPSTGEPYWYDIAIDIDLREDGDEKDAYVELFHTIIDSMKVTFVTEEEYNKIVYGDM